MRNAKKNPKILITGGAGFVGSHLAERLLDDGAEVVILDDFSNGRSENIEHIKDRVVVIEQDISQSLKKIQQKLINKKFNGIFHLACFPRSMSLENPIRDLEVNAKGTLNVLEIAKENNAKVVFTSNSGIAGNPKYLPIDEKHPDNPLTPYDADKLVSEYYMKIYYRIFGVKIAICRLAAVYGERQMIKPGWKPVIPEFVDKLLKGEQPTIFGDGKQTRDLIYVKDVVGGLVKAYSSDKTKDETFILSTCVETSVFDILTKISKILGKKVMPKKAGKMLGDIDRMKLSFNKANVTFGFKPEYDLERGIKNYINWLLQKK